MAKSAVTSLLRRVLSESIAESDLQAQVFSGRVDLADAQLRTFEVTPDLCCTGVLGQASAQWSWTQLLSSPVVVEASQVYIIIKPGSPSKGPVAAAPSEAASSASSQNFFQRMKNRIWDQLSLKVSELHVRLEVPAGPDTGAGGAAGITLGNLVVSVDRDDDSSSLVQTLHVQDVAAYVEPQPQVKTDSVTNGLPDADAFVLGGLSPICRAERRSGRRFVDWRGLDVQVDLTAPKFDWTHAQYRCLLRLAGYVARSAEATPEQAAQAAPAEDDEWQDVREDLTPVSLKAADTTQSPETRRSWWPSWLSLSSSSHSPSELELPDDMRSSDRKLLLQEESEPPETANFTLSVKLDSATLNAKTSCLQLQFGGCLSFSFSVDSWHLGCDFSALSVMDVDASTGSPALVDFSRHLSGMEPQATAAGEVQNQSEPDTGVGTDAKKKTSQEVAPVVLLDVRSDVVQEVLLEVAPVDLRLSPSIINFVQNVTSLEEIESKMQDTMLTQCMDEFFDSLEYVKTNTSAKPWSVSVKLPSVTAVVGEPWLPGARLMLQVQMDGHATVGGACTTAGCADVCASLNLEDDQGKRPCIDECTLKLSYKDQKAMARVSPIDGKIALHELSALFRAARDHIFCKMTASKASDFFEDVPVDGTGSKSESVSIDVCVGDVCFRVIDELGVEIIVNLASPWILYDGSMLSAESSSCTCHVKVDSDERGSLRLTDSKFIWNPQAELPYKVSSAVQVYDTTVDHVALSCSSVTVQASFDAGLSTSPTLEHRSISCFCLRVSEIAPIELDSTEDFVTSLVQGMSYLSDVSASFCVKTVMFDSRPLGLYIQDAKVMRVTSAAAKLGVVPGSTLCGIEPPAKKNVGMLQHLAQCPTPLTLLLEEPTENIIAHVDIDPITLKASRISAKRCIDISVDHIEVVFAGLELTSWRGTWEEFADEITAFYKRSVVRQVPWLATAISIGGQTISQVATRSIASSLAMLRFGAGAAGAIGSTVVVGALDAVSTSARHGTQLRGGEKYKFGDVTRGMLALARNRGRQVLGTYDDAGPERSSSPLSSLQETVVGSSSLVAGYVKSTRAVSTTVGSIAGGSVGAVAGPVGVAAGAAVGGVVGSQMSKTVQDSVQKGKESAGRDPSSGYHFGDFTRGVTAAGREARGGETQGGYKFGDFSRGLFSKATGRGNGRGGHS